MKKHIAILLVLWGITIVGVVPGTAYAEFNLNKLKGWAEKAKAYQDIKNSPTISNEGAADQAGEGLSKSTGTVDEASIKAAQANMDVVGVRVGMTLDEALKVLKAHNPKLTVQEQLEETYADADNKAHVWKMRLYAGDRTTGSEEVTLIISLPPKSRVVNISRVRKYSKSEAPTMTSALEALRKKYGKENLVRQNAISNSGSISEQFFWQVGGRVEKNRPCGAHVRVKAGWNFDTIAYKDDTRCGLALAASVTSRMDNSALIGAVSAAVADFHMAYQDWESSNDYLRNASRLRDKSETEGAKKRSAPVF